MAAVYVRESQLLEGAQQLSSSGETLDFKYLFQWVSFCNLI